MDLTINSFDVGLQNIASNSSRFMCEGVRDDVSDLETEYSDFEEDYDNDVLESIFNYKGGLSDSECCCHNHFITLEDEGEDDDDDDDDEFGAN